MKTQYTIKVSIVEIDKYGLELGAQYSMKYGATSADVEGLKRIMESIIDEHIDDLWVDDYTKEEENSA